MNWQQFLPTEQDEKLARDRRAYIITIASLCFILNLFYTLKYNLEYKIYRFNSFFAVCFFIVIFVAPIVLYLTKKLYYSFIMYYAVCALLGIFLIYTAGGVRAPGVFWLSAIPLFGGVALGRKGAIMGAGYTLIAIVYFYYGEFAGTIENQLDMSSNFYLREKIVNLFIFFMTSIFTTIYFIQKQERAQLEIKEEKEINENLLRILFHDLATPIQILQIKLKKISRLNSADSIEGEINKMDRTIQKLYEQLDNVRKMKAIRDGKVNLNLDHVSIFEMVEKSIDQLAEKLQQKEVRIVVKNESELDRTIYVDQILFNLHILNNLFTNAIKFSDRSGEIHVSWEAKPNHIYIDVKDFGIGMSPHMAKEIFNEKANISRQGTEGEAGTGYGMPIVKNCLAYFEGQIEVKSVERTPTSTLHGTTFRIVLPKKEKPRSQAEKGKVQ